jgi:hypothetical protein
MGFSLQCRQGVFDIMDELELIGKAVSLKFPRCTVLNTGNLLAGKNGATRHETFDAMIAHWMSDPVNSTKSGYTSWLYEAEVEKLEVDSTPVPAKALDSKKRDASLESGRSGHSSRNFRGRGVATYGRRDSAGSSYGYSPYNSGSSGAEPEWWLDPFQPFRL